MMPTEDVMEYILLCVSEDMIHLLLILRSLIRKLLSDGSRDEGVGINRMVINLFNKLAGNEVNSFFTEMLELFDIEVAIMYGFR